MSWTKVRVPARLGVVMAVFSIAVLLSFVLSLIKLPGAKAVSTGPAGVSSGLQLWLTASSGVKNGANDATNGQNVDTWQDQSTAGRNATGTGAVYQTSGLNFNPTLFFTNDNYEAPNTDLATGTADRSIFVVASVDPSSGGGWRYVLGAGTGPGSDPNKGFDFGHHSDTEEVFITNHNNANVTTGSWQNYGSARLAYGALQNRYMYLAVNGETPVLGGGVGQGSVNTVFQGPLNIGANSSGLEYWYGNISEVIFYNRVVTDAERQRINSYLAFKYGFSLDQSTPQSYLASGSAVMWDKDAVDASTYNHGLFGIGRDDASGLSQVKSLGQTATNMITVEAVGEGTNTQPNFHDIDDLEFLVFGDNDGDASWTASGAPAGYQVLERKWKKQEQGDVGAVTLSFNVDDPDMDIPDALGDGEYYFIYDTDGDGSLADESPTALTNDGGGIWHNTVDFGSGGLFTLATTAQPGLSSLNPADNSIDAPVNTNLSLTFSRPMLAGTGAITIRRTSDNSIIATIPATSGLVSGYSTPTVTINPSNDLQEGTSYYVLVDNDAFKDAGENYYSGISNKDSWNFTTVGDSDGIPGAEEAAAPNDGDGNNDGIRDDQQANVASIVSLIDNKYVTLATDASCSLSNVSLSQATSNATQDNSYAYNTGFVNFTATECADDETDVSLYYQDISPNGLTVRKYNPNSHIYATVAGATLSTLSAPLSGALASYTVADNGPLDTNPASGVITDPVGLGSLVPDAPDTGISAGLPSYTLIVLTVSILALISGFAIRQQKKTSSSKHRR